MIKISLGCVINIWKVLTGKKPLPSKDLFKIFLWHFGAKIYDNLHDYIEVFTDLKQLFSNTASKFDGTLLQSMIRNFLVISIHFKKVFMASTFPASNAISV